MHHQEEWILARSHAISNEKLCGREKISKISVRNPLQIASNHTRRSMPTLGTDVPRDLEGSRQGCASPSGTDFGAISRDFESKILRPRKFSENFGPKSHAISRFTACLRSAELLWTFEGREQAEHHEATWISARSRAISNEKFRGRENFSKISARNPI